jgi:pentatricopeptide repeat protein
MKAKEFVAGLENNSDVLNSFSLTTLMHGFCKEGRLTETYHVWDEMRAQGVKLDLIGFTVIAYAAQKLHDREKISMLFREMKVKGVKTDKAFHTCMIHVHSKE